MTRELLNNWTAFFFGWALGLACCAFVWWTFWKEDQLDEEERKEAEKIAGQERSETEDDK